MTLANRGVLPLIGSPEIGVGILVKTPNEIGGSANNGTSFYQKHYGSQQREIPFSRQPGLVAEIRGSYNRPAGFGLGITPASLYRAAGLSTLSFENSPQPLLLSQEVRRPQRQDL